MIAIDNLMTEHQFILKYIALMERYTTNPSILLAKAHNFIAFIHEFADDFHHAKEEDNLFRYLEVPNVLTHCNPVPQMFLEHNQARELVEAMESALLINNLTDLLSAVTQYAELLKQHICKEDNILYPMAERGLSESAKIALSADCATADNRLNGASVWQKYELLYTELLTVI
jgi:hemerythrin-like domain-containing protein